ncbi:MAG: methyltransferase domain-containing protein [Candidatus Hydrogenedentes bacterium]|nr:methyltransferase domain-containing protein [Candidatus Hydrogenedentota bacterium]
MLLEETRIRVSHFGFDSLEYGEENRLKAKGKNRTVGWEVQLAKLHSRYVMSRRTMRLAEIFAKLLPKGSTVLDVGSGNGWLASKVLELRPDLRITGLDVFMWPERQILTLQFDGKTIPCDDESWDYCMASDVLHHTEAPVQLMLEMTRVSRYGVIVKDHIAHNKLDRLELTVMDWLGNRGHGVGLKYDYWSWDNWEKAFKSSGLREDALKLSLGLYSWPLTCLCDRRLHFVARLLKE